MNTSKKLATYSLVLFYIFMFFPLFEGEGQTLSGTIYFAVTINYFGGAWIFKLVIAAVVLFGLFSLHYRPSLQKIARFVVAIFMAILLSLIWWATGDMSVTLSLGFYLEILALVIYVLAVFLPSTTEKGTAVVCKYVGKAGAFLEKTLGEKPKEETPVEAAPVEEDIAEEELEEEQKEAE
ncbi:hypothetical protein [Candidatus Xianfuyuplasma coldseepsis]|uniref:Uncharacterized protein n=1 Tax=Candidatus Xianfuyuplasma coldseepsis TaxID=2782163 RepID=A0A7L7KPD3_9MOLU|nr:hypothetical protein [Xianfuyuplasma coldseepsis]QMS84640.1 hypothetical protein G4Z02_02365 [Xianfuyuplasma coldseepsis]